MPWFKVDDQFWSHPKVVEMSVDAIALWVRAGSYAAQHLTDGRISVSALRMLGGQREVADELVLGGLWVQVDTCTWQFRDWFDYQPTAQEVAERKAKRSAAGRKGADARWHGNSDADAMASAMADSWQTDAPSPSRPRDSSKTYVDQSSSKRARVSTDSFEVSEITGRMAAQKGITSLSAVASVIREHTGLIVDAAGAYQVAVSLLDKAKTYPKAPERYVASAVAKSSLEVQQFIHEHALEVA